MSNVESTMNIPEVKENGKRGPARISVKKAASFDGGMACKFITVGELSEKVNAMFAGAFADYYGCKIEPNNEIPLSDGVRLYTIPKDNTFPTNEMKVTLIFKYAKNVTTGAFRVLSESAKAEKNTINSNPTTSTLIGNMYKNFAGNVNSRPCKLYDVSREALEALEIFLPVGAHPDWDRFRIREVELNNGNMNNTREVVVTITGLSLNKILSAVFGEADDHGRYQYAAEISTAFNHSGAPVLNNLIMCVTRLEEGAVRKLERMTGFNVYQPDNIYVYRA